MYVPFSFSVINRSHANIPQAQRDPDEEGDYMAFEQLMAEAQMKKGKDEKKDAHKSKKDSPSHHHHGHHDHKPEASTTT